MTHPEIIHDETPVRLFKSRFPGIFYPHQPNYCNRYLAANSSLFHLVSDCWTARSKRMVHTGRHFDRSIPLDDFGIPAASLPFSFQTPHTPTGKIILPFPWGASRPAPGKIPPGDADSAKYPTGCSVLFCLCGDHRKTACQPGLGGPLFTGFLVGYLVYDLTHYATHHFPMRSGYAKYLKRYHMQHHYKDSRCTVRCQLHRFGTTYLRPCLPSPHQPVACR